MSSHREDRAIASSRETPTTVFRRCLIILRRLQHGPASKADLIAAVREAIEEPYAGASGRSLDRRFERDKRKLRDVLGVALTYLSMCGHNRAIDVPPKGATESMTLVRCVRQ